MQLVLRHDKVDPAGHLESCEAGARAVVALLASPEATDGDWRPAVDFWRDGRIRKLVRRARGKRWDDVQALPGITVEQGKAAVRALVPGPVRPLVPELDRLQVSGTELPLEPAPVTAEALVAIGISPLITMTTGKAVAQCGHAAQLAWEAMEGEAQERWRAAGFGVRVVPMSEDAWAARPGDVQVVDAGFTELDGPTETTRAWFG
ncbi:peptidyl-tRNA hydrolase [Mariniluteicoccus flavus]